MMKAKRITAAALSVTLMLCGCSNGNVAEEDTTKEETVQQEMIDEDILESKLSQIVPSAYNNADGLALEPGTYISIIGKGSENAYWTEVKAGVKQAEADINAALGYEGNDKVEVSYNAPEEADNVDEQVSLLDEELARYPIALGISIADEAKDLISDDISMLEDMIVLALNDAFDKIDKKTEEKMGKYSSMMPGFM